ncbi:hypothetical protein [Psychromarinibacter sp. S121]|uniref:hypothetical protein n=1 Tax=Psychromarinibacter sp. S121 TaxID=3415127 RepID=UPI003C7AE62C
MSEEDDRHNATRDDLERLNGLLVRALIKKLEADEATATDIGNAVKVIISNRVQPEEPRGTISYANGIPEADLEWPVKV